MNTEKSIDLIVLETKTNLINAINESKLPISVVILILKDILAEANMLLTQQQVKQQANKEQANKENDTTKNANN